MYCYELSLERQYIDYYTDERKSYPADIYQFSDTSIWAARLRLILFIIDRSKDTTIVWFHEMSLKLYTKDKEDTVFLGAWTLGDVSRWQKKYRWNWEAEAAFLEKYALYREGDRELLAIEQAYYQALSHKEIEDKILHLQERLGNFVEKHADSLHEYASELGILYFFVQDYVNAFRFLTIKPSPSLRNITYNTAFYLSFSGQKRDFDYMKKYDTLYDKPPFLGT